MKRIYVNEKWCLACHLCEYYCAFSNSSKSDMTLALKNIAIKPNIRIEEKDKISFAVSCRHCEDPVCVKSCITGALTKGEDGIIRINQDKCIGCYTCILTCPYGCISESNKGVAQKCELCTQNGDTPACAEHCPNNAIVFEER